MINDVKPKKMLPMHPRDIMKASVTQARYGGYRDSNKQLSITEEDYYTERFFYGIIFSHKFAKAFFGPFYITHLQQMVAEEYPLYYMQRHLK